MSSLIQVQRDLCGLCNEMIICVMELSGISGSGTFLSVSYTFRTLPVLFDVSLINFSHDVIRSRDAPRSLSFPRARGTRAFLAPKH